MQDRLGKQVSKKGTWKGAPKVVTRQDEGALQAYFSEGGQHLLPLLKVVRDARASVDELTSPASYSDCIWCHKTIAQNHESTQEGS